MPERPRGGKDELSRTLRDLRRTSGLSARQAAERAGFSQAKVSRVERGINVPTEADTSVLAQIYGATGDVRRRLTELARDIRAEHRPVVMARGKGRPGLFQARLARIEEATAHMGTFTPTVVPGLLQTETYARAVIARRELPTDEADNFIAGRKLRQELLADSEHRFTLITTEGALGWRAGSRDDMATQIDKIAEAVSLPNVRVGIIPWGTQAHIFPLHGWDLYDERAVSYGTFDATAILTEPRDVARYVELFAKLAAMAVYDDNARAVLARIAAEYRGQI